MPRKARTAQDGVCYHVFNRTAERLPVFGEPAECWEFVELIASAQRRRAVELFAACVLPDRFHFILRPRAGEDLGHWMQWILTTQVRRWHTRHKTAGQLWNGRFKTSSIAQDEALLESMRFVEAAAWREGLTAQAQHWAWGSLNWRTQPPAPLELQPAPAALPRDWMERVNTPQDDWTLARVQACLDKQIPYA